MKEISLIVPCYNAIKYIDHFMEALEAQTIGIDQLEVIFVDDASTDATFQKLCEWEQRYPESIMVVHCEKNGKQGAARNIGIEYASAEYLAYADIDDVMDPCMYEKLLIAAKQQECDLVVCRSKKVNPHDLLNQDSKRTKENDWIIEIDNAEKRLGFIQMDLNIAVWNKLYRRSMISENQVYFPEGLIYEDLFFTTLVQHYADKVYILEEELYHHLIWEESTTGDFKDWKKKLDWLYVEELKIIELRKRGIYDEFREHYENQYIINYLNLLEYLIYYYGFISTELVQYLQLRVIRFFPEFMQLNTVIQLLKRDENDFIRIALEGFMQEVTSEYMERLVYSVLPRE